MLAVSCSKGGDDRLAKQEEIRAREQVEAGNNNQRSLNAGAEKELNEMKSFMQAVEGEYSGFVEISNTPLEMYFEIVPSMPIQYYDRLRTREEIQFEKENLTLSIRVLLENPHVQNSAVTCVVENYRPLHQRGLITLVKEGCKNRISLSLTGEDDLSDILTRRQVSVGTLKGSISTAVSSQKYNFKLERL